ncbi:protein TIFY 10A-like [Salvia miltiorrhiza]|uniref:Protein TIFY n=1 Tax=Salvia miltiorrhiza TaxID=226208 RepID=A0A075BFL7_SALMI|nr:protein TIFY 10A-like [Salvia miltiorrhiza]AGC73980.1 jasmonate ZIM-domain protein 1 [Salvia miltiorrhiza]
MVSPEKVDSGKFHGGRSNFSQTCTLLSQYLKERGNFGGLTLNLNPNFPETPKGTVNLLPKIEQPDQNPSEPKPEKEIGQMTIFYAGQVIVLDDIPADKAKEIINLATSYPSAAAVKPHAPQLPPLGSDLPIARKNSLARFLEKRKDRITGTAPYQASKPAVKAEPWLEMGSQYPLQIQRH